jgi:DNA-binding NtrC family response regulator
MNKARLLVVVRDLEHVKELADRAFNGIGYELTEVPSVQKALGRLRREDFDVVIADLVMLADGGLEGLRRAKKRRPETTLLLVSGRSGVFLSVGESESLTARDLCELGEVAESWSMTAEDRLGGRPHFDAAS